MIVLLVGVLALAGVVIVVVASSSDGTRGKNRILTAERDAAVKKVNVAERGLRQIANGFSGNPVLDAQVILDDIANVKELR